VFAARGCPLNCSYCLSNRYTYLYKKYSGEKCPKYRLRDINDCFDEIRQAKRYGAKLIRVKDEVFPVSPKWLEEFIERYPKEIDLPFFGHLRPEFHDTETIRKLKDVGLFTTIVGIQSGSEEIRKNIFKRNLSKDKVIEFAKTLEKLDIQFSYHFIYRNPFEAEHHLNESLEFTYDLPYSSTFIFKLESLPDTPIKNMIESINPTLLPAHIADWYAILHCMSLKSPTLRKLCKFTHKYKCFKKAPFILSILFIPSLIKEVFNVLRNKYSLNAIIPYFVFRFKLSPKSKIRIFPRFAKKGEKYD